MIAARAGAGAGAGADDGADDGADAARATLFNMVMTWEVTADEVAAAPPAGLMCPRCGAHARPVVSHPMDDPAVLRWPAARDTALRTIKRRAGAIVPGTGTAGTDGAPRAARGPRSRASGVKKRRRPRTVVLEVGAGVSIHSVRTEGELLVARGSPSSVLLRVNPDGELVPAARTWAVAANAAPALAALAQELDAAA